MTTPFVPQGVPPFGVSSRKGRCAVKYRDPVSGSSFIRETRRDSTRPGDAYELTFSCYRRFPFLNRDRTRKWFVKAAEQARDKLAFDLWAWVIMPEHVHLLVSPRDRQVAIGQIRSRIKEPVARQAVKYLETYSPEWLQRITVQEGSRTRRRFWQPGGGYDLNCIEIATAHAMIDYIHQNPVRRGLVERATDWEWSSARWYAGLQPVPIEIDATLPMRVE